MNPNNHKTRLNPYRKTSLCRYWKSGTCRKDKEDCDFAHGEGDRKKPPCKFFPDCRYRADECKFGHYPPPNAAADAPEPKAQNDGWTVVTNKKPKRNLHFPCYDFHVKGDCAGGCNMDHRPLNMNAWNSVFSEPFPGDDYITKRNFPALSPAVYDFDTFANLQETPRSLTDWAEVASDWSADTESDSDSDEFPDPTPLTPMTRPTRREILGKLNFSGSLHKMMREALENI